jgi:hypothetical protein
VGCYLTGDGRTKQEVRDKLKALHAELDAGIRSSAGYTVRRAVEELAARGAGRLIAADPRAI